MSMLVDIKDRSIIININDFVSISENWLTLVETQYRNKDYKLEEGQCDKIKELIKKALGQK